MIKPPDSSVSKVGAVAPGSAVERMRPGVGRLLVALGPAASQRSGFVIGEVVSARLVEPLQNRQWLAVVKGNVITLQWPAAGDASDTPASPTPTPGATLSLQVASLAPRLTFVAMNSPAASASAAVAVELSSAAQTITELLHAGEGSPVPDRSAPDSWPILLVDPAAPPAERAQALAQAVSHSGLFYESHLLAWAEGRLPLSSLGREPQAHIAQMMKDADPGVREAASAELGAVLQRQLDALDGRPLALSGLAWPGQPAGLHIQRDAPDPRDDDGADEPTRDANERAPAWTTQIDLVLPSLGALGAQVRVRGSHVTLALTLGSERGSGLATLHRERLASALQAAGLTLTELTLQRPASP